MSEHKISDLVYSNSYGLGFINHIEESLVRGTRYSVEWFNQNEYSGYAPSYSEQGIDTLKMFLRVKRRGGDI